MSDLYICLISIHGLIKAHNPELGRDPDTGGQIKYVIELAEALGKTEGISKVDLLTRRIVDENLDSAYSEKEEIISQKSRIVRLDAGPDEYIAKEQLWDHLDSYVDNAVEYLRTQSRLPDLLHSHYADAGYVGSKLSHILGIPLVHTGHSLGRVKRRRLIAAGLERDFIEERYNMTRRIEAEETTLASAVRVITSTHQEIEEQYELYDFYQPQVMHVIAPGTNLEHFYPSDGNEWQSDITAELTRFLQSPEKPIVLAIARPDARKNFSTLISAFGESPALQEVANLVLVAGNRDDINEMDTGSQEVIQEIFQLIDLYDLYGKVAYPKHHQSEDISTLYRLAALSRGVFVNPALTEPFGLTLIEAAACGLPIVATEDGGPRDIIGNCKNGILVDPLDAEAIAESCYAIITDNNKWNSYSSSGIAGVTQFYSWSAHARQYLQMLKPVLASAAPPIVRSDSRPPASKNDRALFSDLDKNLLGNTEELPELVRQIRSHRKKIYFGIATGRHLSSALKVMRKNSIPEPDVLITSLGTEIYYAPQLNEDLVWRRHIEKGWTPQLVRRALTDIPGIVLQPKEKQGRFKISYFINPDIAPPLEEIQHILHREDLSVNVIFSFGQFLDILPIRASKGLALRYFAARWGVALDHILTAGGSGADEDMMLGNTLAVVVENRHQEELSQLKEADNIYFASRAHAGGILEAIDYYDFFDRCSPPETTAGESND
ncbi:MAG: HAD-IIB family hydrolase [bacterium]|nr:HAD-IIB family hydrolase [bacterium]